MWAIVLPTAFLLAITVRPQGLFTRAKAKDEFAIDFSHLNDTTTRVTITVVQPLRVPSCLVFGHLEGSDVLLGRLGPQKIYSFDMRRAGHVPKISLFDPIHGDTLATSSPEENR
jgi:hypothetical protein